MAEECFELRCDGEHLQIPLTQEATATTVTEGTETLPATKKMNEKVFHYTRDDDDIMLVSGSESGK